MGRPEKWFLCESGFKRTPESTTPSGHRSRIVPRKSALAAHCCAFIHCFLHQMLAESTYCVPDGKDIDCTLYWHGAYRGTGQRDTKESPWLICNFKARWQLLQKGSGSMRVCVERSWSRSSSRRTSRRRGFWNCHENVKEGEKEAFQWEGSHVSICGCWRVHAAYHEILRPFWLEQRELRGGKGCI